MSQHAAERSIRESLAEYGRGVAGGLLFALPLLYTMEVWWHGLIAHPFRLLLYVIATFALLLGYNRYAGLRDDASFLEVILDSIEEMGIGLVLSALILWLLDRIRPEMPAHEIFSLIVIEAMTVAIGVSVGTAQLGTVGNADDNGQSGKDQGVSSHEDGDGEKQDSNDEPPRFWEQAVIALCGAVLIAANVGPTEEIVMLAVEAPTAKLLALAVFSLLLSLLILHFSDFRGSHRFTLRGDVLAVLSSAVTTYAVALLASAGICWFFGRLDGVSFEIGVAQTVILAFPATLGASAGRLLMQSNSQ